MKQRPRIYYSASQRALIWERWQRGETLHQIAGWFDRYHSSIQRIVAETGGIRPAERRRSRPGADFARPRRDLASVKGDDQERFRTVSIGLLDRRAVLPNHMIGYNHTFWVALPVSTVTPKEPLCSGRASFQPSQPR